jgi:hypothetical protein
MTRLFRALALVVCLCGPATAQASGKGVWLRRATLAAACAASFWDVRTTRTAVSLGALERNRLLAGPDGKPRWGRMIGIKAGLCAGSAAAQELRLFVPSKPLGDAAWTAANAAIAGSFVRLSLGNRRVAGELRGEAAAPRHLMAEP